MTSPFFTPRELAIYLRKLRADGSPDIPTANKWIVRAGVRKYRAGRSVLVRREDVDRAIGLTPAPMVGGRR